MYGCVVGGLIGQNGTWRMHGKIYLFIFPPVLWTIHILVTVPFMKEISCGTQS